jgi:Flp pilus assembly pilin Flp
VVLKYDSGGSSLDGMTRLLRVLLAFLKDKRGSPLVEEGLLLGLAILTVTILIALIVDVMGWSQGLFQSILVQLDQLRQAFLGWIGG